MSRTLATVSDAKCVNLINPRNTALTYRDLRSKITGKCELNEFMGSLTNTDLLNIRNCDCIHTVFVSLDVDDDECKQYIYMNLLNQNDMDKEYMLNDIVHNVNEKLENLTYF